jgi:hypothetical protein
MDSDEKIGLPLLLLPVNRSRFLAWTSHSTATVALQASRAVLTVATQKRDCGTTESSPCEIGTSSTFVAG